MAAGEAHDTTAPRRAPLFGAWATVLIAALLVVPFVVAKLTGSEPYPAVIFPGGGSAIRVADGRAEFATLTLYTHRPDGGVVEVDAYDFLDPIPASYLDGLARTEFGQGLDSTTA